VNSASRPYAFLSYLLSLPGALGVLLARPNDRFSIFHARQSLWLWGVALAAPLAWMVLSWALAWIPIAGAMLGVTLFALVLAIETLTVAGMIMGMVGALRGRTTIAPLIGRLAAPRRARPAAAVSDAVDVLAAPDSGMEPSVEVERALEQQAASERHMRDA
jgi:uncharacterized membrane protein